MTAQTQFQTDLLNNANDVIGDIKQQFLYGSYHHLNYMLMNGNSIVRRTARAKNKTRHYLDNIGFAYLAALNIDAQYNGGKIKPVVNVTDMIRRGEQLVYPKLPEFSRENEEIVALHTQLLNELNTLNGYSSANIATDCQSADDIAFQNCLGDKIVAFNATTYQFCSKVRAGAKLSIGNLQRVDETYDEFLANGIRELTKDITLQMNQLAESVYVQGNTGRYILEFGKMHMEWTVNGLVPTIDKLAADIEEVFSRVNQYFKSTPNAFSADAFRSRLDKLNVTIEIKVVIGKLTVNKEAVQNDTFYNIINKYVLLFANTIKTYDDSLDIIHLNSVKNKTRAAEIKVVNSPVKFEKIDPAYLDCYNATSSTPNQSLMSCINDKRYSVEEELTIITECLETLYQEVLPLSTIPFLELQDEFLSYAESELTNFLGRLKQ